MKKKQDAQRKHLQAFVDRFRAKATQGAAGAIAHQDAGQDAADRRAGDRRGAADPLSGAGQTAVAADHRHRRRRRSATSPGIRCCRGLTLRIDNDDRIALLGSNGNGKSTLVKLLAGRLAPEHGTRDARGDAQGRLFRPAPARRTRRGPQPLRSRARSDAGTAGSQSARQGRRDRIFRPSRQQRRSRRCRAARRRGCCSGSRPSPRRISSSSTSRPTISTSTAAPR